MNFVNTENRSHSGCAKEEVRVVSSLRRKDHGPLDYGLCAL